AAGWRRTLLPAARRCARRGGREGPRLRARRRPLRAGGPGRARPGGGTRARAVQAPEAGRIERLSAADARKLFPPLRAGQEGLLVSGGARVDGRRMAAALQRAAVKRGVRHVAGSAELVMRGDRACGVRVDGEVIEAGTVVVAAGAWAGELLAPAGVVLAVAPQRGQIVHLRLPGTDTT